MFLLIEGVTTSGLLAMVIGGLMAVTSVVIVFYHDRKHDQLDQWIDFSFSGTALRQALGYYRFMAISMLVFYMLFTCSCVFLQYEGHRIFADANKEPILAGPIATALFALDLVCRGGFFDIMEHFDLRVAPVYMNTREVWFVIYAFAFRMFYALSLIKILLSFAWIYGKIRRARMAYDEQLKVTPPSEVAPRGR